MIRHLIRSWRTKNQSATNSRQATAIGTFDLDFVGDLTRSLRSHADFLLARTSGDDARISSAAADVLVSFDSAFSTVSELVDACASHGWNSTIYEAWVWQTAQFVHDLEATLDETSAAALRIHAQHLDYYEIDAGEMYRALDEARRALEGEPLLD